MRISSPFLKPIIFFALALMLTTGCSGQNESLLQKLGLALVDRTVWTIEEGVDGEKGFFVNGDPIILKGVCYSPTPINDNNKQFPALGDYFWDTFNAGGDTIYNWFGLWGNQHLGGTAYDARNDLKKIRELNANAIRVYTMMSRQPNEDGSYPAPRTGQHFTHNDFLGLCFDDKKGGTPIYVIVGIPMPACAFQKAIPPAGGDLAFYEAVLDETTKDLAKNPAVIGFTIMNEMIQNGASHYDDGITTNANTDYFYSQVKKYAAIAKKNAPDKLVGWAINDNPVMLKYANTNHPTATVPADLNLDKTKTYLENISGNIDYWGVNTYQLQAASLSIVLGSDASPTGIPYGYLTGSVRKPVILTEYGWPATGHDAGDGHIYTDTTTQTNVADKITPNFTAAFGYDILEGVFYFEFSDEWWKQSGTPVYEWNGTSDAENTAAWPNGYADEEGFGLFGIQRTPPRTPTDSNWNGNGPALPVDTLIERTPMTTALKGVYDAH